MSKLTTKALAEADKLNASFILLNLDTYGGALEDGDKIRTLLIEVENTYACLYKK
jgi:membrane-bound serine protease (ClpP class)